MIQLADGSGSVSRATRGERLGAKLVDGIVMLATFGVGYGCGHALTGGGDSALAFGVVSALLMWIVQCFLLTTSGQTLGKKLVGIRVLRVTGEEAGFMRIVIIREVVVAVLSRIPFVGLIDAAMIFGDEHRCMHDYMAGTIVVNTTLFPNDVEDVAAVFR